MMNTTTKHRIVLFDTCRLEFQKDQIKLLTEHKLRTTVAETLLKPSRGPMATANAVANFLREIRRNAETFDQRVNPVISQLARTADPSNTPAVVGKYPTDTITRHARNLIEESTKAAGRKLLRAHCAAVSLQDATRDLDSARTQLEEDHLRLERTRDEVKKEHARIVQQLSRSHDLVESTLSRTQGLVRDALTTRSRLDFLSAAIQKVADLDTELERIHQHIDELTSTIKALVEAPKPGLTPPKPGVRALVTEAQIDADAEYQAASGLLRTTDKRRKLLEKLVNSDPADATDIVRDTIREVASGVIERTASDWAAAVYPEFHARRQLVNDLVNKDIADVRRISGVPDRRFAWIAADQDFQEFRDEVATHVDGSLNEAGDQPSVKPPSNPTKSTLLMATCWLGIRSEHLQIVEDCRPAWEAARKAGNFGFSITTQKVPPLPKAILPPPRHEPPQLSQDSKQPGDIRPETLDRELETAWKEGVRRAAKELRLTPTDGQLTNEN